MKKYIISSLAILSGLPIYAQSAIDGFRLSQPDMKGTARYMSMAGAFSALGGDLSAITQNPGGIGVYRSSDIGFTLDLDLQSSSSNSLGLKTDFSQTKFLLNNIGAVFTLRLPSNTCPNLNFGFVYNKGVSYNRKYGGTIPYLENSMSNYIAGITNSENIVPSEIQTTGSYDPYNPGFNEYAPPWLSILGYDSYLITPESTKDGTNWYGQWGQGTKGNGSFLVEEKGALNEYNIILGGNISNVVYWGMNFDIINLNYSINSIWGENLTDAYIPNKSDQIERGYSNWDIQNSYSVHGTGFKYVIGLIVKPIQELRLGISFQTPTWYNLTESFGASTQYQMGNGLSGYTSTNDGYLGYNDVSFRTPLKLTAGAAAVLANRFILSFDYEFVPYNKMKYSEPSDNYWWDGGYYPDDPWYGWDYATPPAKLSAQSNNIFESNDPYYYTNSDIATYYQHSNTFRLGAEFRLSSAFSVRAGYSYVSSPVKKEAKDNQDIIYTSGTLTSYRFDNSTNYLSLGLGWKYKYFYADLAYVYKHMSSTYHAYSPDPSDTQNYIPSPQANISLDNNQIILSAGFRF